MGAIDDCGCYGCWGPANCRCYCHEKKSVKAGQAKSIPAPVNSDWEINHQNHDEFCNQAVGRWDGGCQCETIAQVRESERAYVISVIEELPCKCDESKDYCDGQTDAINAIEAIDTPEEVTGRSNL